MEVSGVPLIQVSLIEGAFTVAERRALAERLTDAFVQVAGEALRPVTWCVVEEVRGGSWSLGGSAVAASDLRAMRAGSGG